MSEDQDPDSKTEDPTDKRLADAREKGQVTKTQELTHVLSMLTGIILVLTIFPSVMSRMMSAIRPFIERPHEFQMDAGSLGSLMISLLIEMLLVVIVPFLLLMASGVLATVVQIGFLFSTESVFKLNFNKFNPIANLKQKLSIKNLIEFLKSLIKLGIVGAVVTVLLMPLWDSMEYLIAIPITRLLSIAQEESAKLMFGVLLVMGLIAGGDFLFQRFQFMKQMRMSKQDVKDEHKQSEGDPMIKGRRRGMMMQRARQRMMANVPKADVVVTNPTHFAVALAYKPQEMSAPVVLAKGVDTIARKIREVAEENDIPLVENPPLARALYATAEIDEEIPAEHYQAVAQVISYVFKLKRKPFPQ